MSQRLEIPVEHPHVDCVGALHDPGESGSERSVVLLAHGAGADMESDFMIEIARGLASRGMGVLRFNYPYMERARREQKRRPPDRAPVLEACHRAALAEFERLAPDRRIVLAGKSMGGRMASRIVAQGEACAALCFLGYPLHPADKPTRERSEHFPAICVPALFLQGDRDKLCELPRLERALETYGGQAKLVVIEDGDHGFAVRKRETGLTRADVMERLLGEIDAWEREL